MQLPAPAVHTHEGTVGVEVCAVALRQLQMQDMCSTAQRQPDAHLAGVLVVPASHVWWLYLRHACCFPACGLMVISCDEQLLHA
jgi:hypothetical protein